MIGGVYCADYCGGYYFALPQLPRPKYNPPVVEDAWPLPALRLTVVGPGMCERVVRWLQLSQRTR